MSKTAELQLPENLTITNIHPIHERLESLVGSQTHDHIVIKSEAVQKADTAGLQLLYAFHMAAKERQISLAWHSPSDKLLQVANTLGMGGVLGLN